MTRQPLAQLKTNFQILPFLVYNTRHNEKAHQEILHDSTGRKEARNRRQAVHDAVTKGTLRARETKVTKSEWLISAEELESYRPSNRHQAAGKKIIDA